MWLLFYWPFGPFCMVGPRGRGQGSRSFVVDFLFVENGKDVYLHG